jgi:signal transduction histidine kinase
VQLLTDQSTRLAGLGAREGAARLPSWLGRTLQPQGFAGGPAELAWTAALLLLVLAVAAVEELAGPRTIGAGALTVVPVLAASWTLSGRKLAAVVALTVVVTVAMTAAGTLTLVALAARLLAVMVVALAGRTAAVSTAAVSRSRQREVSTLLRAAQLLGRAIDQPGTAAEVASVAAGALTPAGAADRRPAVLVRVDPDGASVAVGADGTAASGPAVPLAHLPRAFQDALDGGAAAVVPASELEPVLGRPDGVAWWALAGVQVDARPFGVLAVGSDPAGFPAEDLRLLGGVARVAGHALGASLRHSELDQLRQRLQHSMELAVDVARSLAPDQVHASILVRVAEAVGADQSALARVSGTDLVVESAYRAGRTPPVRRLGRHFPPESVEGVPDLAGALATGRPVIGGALRARVGGEELVAALPAAPCTLTFPFAFGGRIACLLVLGRHGGPQFDAGDLARLEPMADVALLGLRNAHLHADVERARRDASTWSGRLQLAIEAAEDIGSSGELSEVVDRVLRRAVAVVHAERGRISQLEGDELVVEHDHHPGSAEAAAAGPRRVERSRLAAEAVVSRRSVRGTVFGPEGAEHVIECPLVVEREVVGLLQLARRRDDPFTEADLLTLQPFATLAALMLRNARLLAEARRVGQAKSAFLSLAAHELRTPLAVIKGYLSLLEDGTYPVPQETREEAVGTLLAKSQELDSLVEALLTTARLEAGALARAEGSLDACEAVQDAVARIRPRARLEGARIDVRLPHEDRTVRADRTHVARILDNLLNNALTYSSRPARVAVEVRSGDPIELAVSDHGPGIAAEHRERVFERFHRVEGGGSRFSPGLGLGLAIARDLAVMNGGELVLEETEAGAGSVFVLRLPALAREPAQP